MNMQSAILNSLIAEWFPTNEHTARRLPSTSLCKNTCLCRIGGDARHAIKMTLEVRMEVGAVSFDSTMSREDTASNTMEHMKMTHATMQFISNSMISLLLRHVSCIIYEFTRRNHDVWETRRTLPHFPTRFLPFYHPTVFSSSFHAAMLSTLRFQSSSKL